MTTPLLLIIPSLCILLISSFYALLLKRKVVETLFLAVTTVIIVLFLGGLLNFRGSLLVGYLVILLFSAFSLFYTIKHKEKISTIELKKGLIAFTLFLLLSLFLNYGRLFTHFDEFTHWGLVLKNMYHFDAVSTYESINIYFKSYVPATSLFQYFWIRPFGVFIEYAGYIGFNMFFFSLSSILLSKLKPKNILLFLSFLLIPLITSLNFYSTLLVDTMLGVLFGSILLFYYGYRKEDFLFTYILITAISIVLTLTKNTGIIFVFLSFLLLSTNELILSKEYLRKKVDINLLKKLFLLLAPFLLSILFHFLWSKHTELASTQVAWTSSSSNPFSNGLLPYQKEILDTFLKALFTRPIRPINLSYAGIVTALSLVEIALLFLIKLRSKERKRVLSSIFVLYICSFIYASFPLYFYLFLLPLYEAVNLASFSRYLFPYIVGMLIFFLYFIKLLDFSPKKWRYILSCGLISLFYVFLLSHISGFFYSDIVNAREGVRESVQIREPYNEIRKWSEHISTDDRVYLISQGDMGYDALVLRYILSPTNMVFRYDYSVGLQPYHLESLYDNYPFTKIVEPKEWSEYVVEEYTLLYLFRIDQKFEDIYGKYFDNVSEGVLYRVSSNEYGVLELISLD